MTMANIMQSIALHVLEDESSSTALQVTKNPRLLISEFDRNEMVKLFPLERKGR